MPSPPDNQPLGEFLLYETEDGKSRVECRFQDETLWLSQPLMADLFEKTPQNITLHLKVLYEEEEIIEEATYKDYLQVRLEGKREVKRSVRFYNLEAILAVGFRVRSRRGSQFRCWANRTSEKNEIMIKKACNKLSVLRRRVQHAHRASLRCLIPVGFFMPIFNAKQYG